MKKLSINIPTYNRDTFLEKNLNIIIAQLKKDKLEDIVEINISDNASTDNTKFIIDELIKSNHDILITYKRNENNLGPDLNFINAMLMANGEFSILWGDDDYFENGAIKHILEVIDCNKEVTFFLSNRISIDINDKLKCKHKFFRKDIGTEIFDFSNTNDVRAFFAVSIDHGGILTFISSVVYKTNIIDEVGDYDSACTGSCYSFLYYWWSSIIAGKKLMYLDEYFVRATAIGITNNNYGKGIKRLLIDTEGLSTIAERVFTLKSNRFKEDFLCAVRRPISNFRIYSAIINGDNGLTERLFSSMIRCGWPSVSIEEWKYMLSKKNIIKMGFKCFAPSFVLKKIHFS